MNDRLQELTVFLRTAESGSFSRAGRELGLSQSSVSRIVNDLETRLGVKLLLRSTRRVVPTEAGAMLLQRARQILRDLEDAEDAARGTDSLRGTIRVAMSMTFGVREVIPILPPFLAANPLLRVEIIMSEHRHDLVLEGADVAIRFGQLQDSGFGARRLASAQRLVVASPVYLKMHGNPQTPADLAGHDLIFGPGGSSRHGWAFAHRGATMGVDLDARLQVDTGEGMIACVKAGLGVGIASVWMCRAELRSGALVPILNDYELDPTEVHAVYPAGPRPTSKVRAFVDFLAKELPGTAGLDQQPC
jgi:DNA-binding transcriptional LysR family regulator